MKTSSAEPAKGGLALLAAVFLLGACSGAGDIAESPPEARQSATTSAAPAPADPERAARSQAVLDGAITDDEPGCSAAVGIEGEVAWSGTHGLADLESGEKITERTVFDIASVSKQFTATAVLLLADNGKLSIEDSLASHVPGLPPWAETVTVSQLIHQTSGIPDYIGLLEDAGYAYTDPTTQAQAVQALANVPELEFDPGTQFEYSNSNYLLLAEIVQKVSGQPLPAFLSQQIFTPLDLAMSMDPKLAPDSAVPYDYDDGTDEYTVAVSAWEQIGDGAIQTTPSQLVRWADNYRTGKVGGQALLDAQLAGAVETGDDGDRYGAGIYLLPDGGLTHDGSWSGSVTSFHISPDRRTAIAVSCNTGNQDPEALAGELGKLWR
jgi:CubicO group peptidase (beta-lactamase class C family)